MDELIRSIVDALESENWYAALCVALTLPDICGYLENPSEKGIQTRYEKWFERYMLPRYQRVLAMGIKHTFLHPADCFALRCAVLHSSDDSITEQRAKEVLERFQFVKPSLNFSHCNQSGSTLQLQVDVFCAEIIDGVRHWLDDIRGNTEIENRIVSRMKIYPS